jgi:acetyltransferase-like isoleucine patch superfamily enzyme
LRKYFSKGGNLSKRIEAFVDSTAQLSEGVQVWDGAHVREGVSIGAGSSVGQFAYIGPGVSIGLNCKIQNHALVYEPAVLHDGVFIGPRAVITNDLNPRAINLDGSRQTAGDWSAEAAEIMHGASLGAGAICVGPIVIGRWAMVAAGAVVTKNVPDYALVVGVPAKKIGWVGEAGAKLTPLTETEFECPISKRIYRVVKDGVLEPSS